MPKSPYGKARSRMNALKHGLRATDELFTAHLKEDERNVFTEFRESLHLEYNPQTQQEKLLVDRIAIQNFRLYRLYQLEYDATDQSQEKPISRDSIIPYLDRVSRYDSRIEKQLHMLHNRLSALYMSRQDFSLTYFSAKE
jgi:hypothetical protein